LLRFALRFAPHGASHDLISLDREQNKISKSFLPHQNFSAARDFPEIRWRSDYRPRPENQKQ